MAKKIFVIMILTFTFGLAYCYFNNNDRLAIINTEISKNTIVTPVLDAKIELDKNLIYCSTTQIAWNKLCNDILKGTLEIENGPWYVSKLNELINELPQISEDSYVALAGFGKENIVEKIKDALLQKFNVLPIIDFPDVGSNELLSFSYMQKSLDFETIFHPLKSYISLGTEEIKIKSFGFEYNSVSHDSPLKKQVEMLYFDWSFGGGQSAFIIELKTTSSIDEILISDVKPETTLIKTYNKIQELIQQYKYDCENFGVNKGMEYHSHGYQKKFMSLSIPKIKFNIIHVYKDLANKRFKNPNFSDNYIKQAVQNIQFSLNEKGARIKALASIGTKMGDPPRLEIHGPFVIIIKNRNSKTPYFMAYIGNDELLEKQNGIMDYFNF